MKEDIFNKMGEIFKPDKLYRHKDSLETLRIKKRHGNIVTCEKLSPTSYRSIWGRMCISDTVICHIDNLREI